MPTSTDDRRELLPIIAGMRAKPGKEQELRDALTSLVTTTAQEDGYVDDALHEAVEQNASDTEPVHMVVARSTQEVVVSVEGHPHRPAQAS